MTTAQRAAYLSGDRKPNKLRAAFRKKINSSHKIESIKGLKLQSFFYGLVAGLVDMELVRADMNPNRDPAAQADYDRVTAAIRGVEQSFLNAGYSCKGNPYWTDLAGPNDRQIEDIIAAAEECVPILQDRWQKMQKDAGQGSKDRGAFGGFVDRFAGFNQAITDFEDHISHRQRHRDRLNAAPGLPICALA